MPQGRGWGADALCQDEINNMTIKTHSLLPTCAFHINRVRKVKGELQLLLRVNVRLDNGGTKDMKILVDTGAEANLIRRIFFG